MNTPSLKHMLALALVTVLPLSSGNTLANSAIATQASQVGQTCPPDGFVQPTIRQIKNAEFQYCTALDDNVLKRRECVNWVSAKEYVKFKTNRSDAIYSGMAIYQEKIILYYCLPPKK